MRYVAMLTVFCVGSVALSARADDKKDVDKLNGKWVASALNMGGMEIPAQTLKDIPWYWEVESGKVLSLRPGAGGRHIYKEKIDLTLDPSKEVKTIDITDVEKKETMKGIYKLDGDTFTVCFAVKPTDERPTDFTVKAGNNRVMITWKRVKN